MTTPESSPSKGFPKVTLTKTEDAPLVLPSQVKENHCILAKDAGRQGLDRHRVLFDKGRKLINGSFALKDACSLQL